VSRLLVIVGPTASGKTALACALAERIGGEIVSSDSQQCYRGLDVGTAKPGAAERARARHHLLDVAEPEEQLDAARFVQLADAAIADIEARGKRAIVAGGTGLWIRALLKGLVDAPPGNAAFRASLRRELAEHGLPALHARLRELDPESAQRIHATDRVRIERALEVHALTGRPLSALQRAHAFADARHEADVIHLDPPRELLWQRIEERTASFFAPGSAFLDEVRALRTRIERVPAAAKALKIIGYGEAAEALAAGTPEALVEAQRRVLVRTRQYAKRQRTWFKKEFGPGTWPIDPGSIA
jgi:tRNA dimethylallyltransferase